MGWFKHWFGTRYYSLLYGHRDAEDARAWVDAIAQRWGPVPGESLLDLACGRGRHAGCFISKGLCVTGVDISEASITEARNMVPAAVFRVHDIREPFSSSEFDRACCLFTSLGYFDRLDDDRAVFTSVFTALKPGGRFVLDFMNTELVLRDLVPTEELELAGVRFCIERRIEGATLIKHIQVIDDGETHWFEERVQTLMPEQLEAMALEAGFLIEDRTDGPVLSPFDPIHSDRFVLWMLKPGP